MNFPHNLQNPQQGQQAVSSHSQDTSNPVGNYQHHMFYYPQQPQQLNNQRLLSQPQMNQYLNSSRNTENNTTNTTSNNNNNNNSNDNSNDNTTNNSVNNCENRNKNVNNIHENGMVAINNTNKGSGNSFTDSMLVNNPLLNEGDSTLLSHMNLNQLFTNPNNINNGNSISILPVSQVNSRTNHKSKKTNSRNVSNGPNNNKITTSKDRHTTNNISDIFNPSLSHPHSDDHDTLNDRNSKNTSNLSNVPNVCSKNANTNTSGFQTQTLTNNGSMIPPHMDNSELKKNYKLSDVSPHTKDIPYYPMNNNPHVINDPSIQEFLSPYFQPFGVDVSHLPMTNPPIFQTSLPLYDEPVGRRRISISNGQISQLGDDIETVEDLYNTQPPPMPSKDSINTSHPTMDNTVDKQQVPPQTTHTIHPNTLNIPSPNVVDRNSQSQPQPLPIQIKSVPNQQGWPHSISAGKIFNPNTIQQQYALLVPHDQSIPSHNQSNEINSITNPALMIHTQLPLSLNQQNLQPQAQPHLDQQQESLSHGNVSNIINTTIDNNVKTMASNLYEEQTNLASSVIPHNSVGHSTQSNDVNSPGTEAWKRARLLERNRIAASKCRKRKKIAQLQLQKDFDNLVKENMVIKKKLKYYEKLITKFRKFTKAHFENCHNSNGLNDLKMIEDMLMIDQDIYELDNDNSIVGLTDRSFIK